MTEIEAIKICNTIGFATSFSNPQGVPLNTTKEELTEAIRMSIQTLEKQIAKKPEYEADGYADGELVYDYAKCPICGHDFEYGINDWGCEYCSDCGQKLDWSDKE